MAYPILASNFSWYKSSQARSTITQINIVDSYTPTGNEDESWNADTGNTGSIKCYRVGTVVTIAGNGSGKISMNASSIGFFANSTNVRFTSLKHITGANLLDTSNVTTVNSMFYGCTSLISVDVSNWNLSNLTSMKTMFYECKALTELDVSKWNLSKVTSMQGAFRECNSLTNLPAGNWDVSNVTDMSYMFYECNSLSTLDTSSWNVSNVTNMAYMFTGCSSLVTLDISKWDVSNVTTFQGMFNCGVDSGANLMSYAELDVSNWNTLSCTNMSFMFYGVDSLKTIDVSGWNVSKVTNFDHMFAHSHINIGDISKWDTSSATNMNGMFHSIQNTIIDVSNFNTSKVFAFGQMFEYCNKLTSIIGLENFDTSSGIDFAEMFHGCTQLKELNLNSFDTKNAKDGISVSTNGGTSLTMYNIFYDTPRLEKITLGENFSFNGDGTTINASNIAVLPTSDPTYITGADGKWYTIAAKPYAPAEIPDKTANTYYASIDIVRDMDLKIKNGTLLDIATSVKQKAGITGTISPLDIPDKINEMDAGINTFGTTATSNNIQKGKTAFVNNVKIIGALPKTINVEEVEY